VCGCELPNNPNKQKAQNMAVVIPIDQIYRHHIPAPICKFTSFEENVKRQQLRSENIAPGTIHSDNPEVLPMLRIRLEQYKLAQYKMKTANGYVRKSDREGLRRMRISEAEIKMLFNPDFTGHIGYSPYLLSLTAAEIRRLRRRISVLEHSTVTA